MKSLLAAVQFLTLLPFKTRDPDRHLPAAMACFPVVGLLLGLILAGTNYLLGYLNLDGLAVNVILVLMLVIITGGLHLDGLADTSDALMSGKSREEMLGIMRDPRIGTMGVLSLISIILLEISLLSSIAAPRKAVALIMMCVFSRWAMSLSIFLFPYARQEGKARLFIDGRSLRSFIISTAVTAAIAVIAMGIDGLIVFAVAALGAHITGKAISAKLGGITGDVIGATNELIEAATLISICILQKLAL